MPDQGNPTTPTLGQATWLVLDSVAGHGRPKPLVPGIDRDTLDVIDGNGFRLPLADALQAGERAEAAALAAELAGTTGPPVATRAALPAGADGDQVLVLDEGAVYRHDGAAWSALYQVGVPRVASVAALRQRPVTVGGRVRLGDREYLGVAAGAHALGDVGYGGLFVPGDGDPTGASGWWDLLRDDPATVRSEWWGPPHAAVSIASHYGFATAAEVRAAHPWVDDHPHLLRSEWAAWGGAGVYDDAALLAQKADWLAVHAALEATPAGGTCVLSGDLWGDRRLVLRSRDVRVQCDRAVWHSGYAALPNALGAVLLPDFDFDAALPDVFGVEAFLGAVPAVRFDTATVEADGELFLEGDRDPTPLDGLTVLVRLGVLPNDPIESPTVYDTPVKRVEDLGGGRWRAVVEHQGVLPPVHTLEVTAVAALGDDGAGRATYEITVEPLTGALKEDNRYRNDLPIPIQEAVFDFGGGRVVRVLPNDGASTLYPVGTERVLVAVDEVGGAAPQVGDSATWGDQYWAMPLGGTGGRVEGELTVVDEEDVEPRSSGLFHGFTDADLSGLTLRTVGFDAVYTDLTTRGSGPARIVQRAPSGRFDNPRGLDSQVGKGQGVGDVDLEGVRGTMVEIEGQVRGLRLGRVKGALSGDPVANVALVNVTPAAVGVRAASLEISGGGVDASDTFDRSPHVLMGTGGPLETVVPPAFPDAAFEVGLIQSRVKGFFPRLFDAFTYEDPVTGGRWTYDRVVRKEYDLDLGAGEIVADLSGHVRSFSIRVDVPGEDGSAPLAAGTLKVMSAAGATTTFGGTVRSGRWLTMSAFSNVAQERAVIASELGTGFCDARLFVAQPTGERWPEGSRCRLVAEVLTNDEVERAPNLLRLDYTFAGLAAGANTYGTPDLSEAAAFAGAYVGSGTPDVGIVLPAGGIVAAHSATMPSATDATIRGTVLYHAEGANAGYQAALNPTVLVGAGADHGSDASTSFTTIAVVPPGQEVVARLTPAAGYTGPATATMAVWVYAHGRGPWVTA